VVTTRGLAANIALKTGAEFSEIMLRILHTTARLLHGNALLVRLIASELERRKIICRSRLASHLKNVSGHVQEVA
jgi:hypothetical protein